MSKHAFCTCEDKISSPGRLDPRGSILLVVNAMTRTNSGENRLGCEENTMKNEKQLKKYAPESMKMQEIKSGKVEGYGKHHRVKKSKSSDRRREDWSR